MSAFEPVRYAALTDVGVKRSHNQDACSAHPAVDAPGFAVERAHLRRRRRHGRARGRREGQRQGRPRHPAPLSEARPRRRHPGPPPGVPARRTPASTPSARRTPSSAAWARPSPPSSSGPKARGSATSATAGPTAFATAVAEQLTFDHSWVWEIAKRQGVDPGRTRRLQEERHHPLARARPGGRGRHRGAAPGPAGRHLPAVQRRPDGRRQPDRDRRGRDRACRRTTAVRFLVHLANLRGGPDNITVMIVRVPGGAQGEPAVEASGAGRAQRGW